MLAIPFSLPRTFGRIVGDDRQGFAILGVMTGLFTASFLALTAFELGTGGEATRLAGAAMEGKELRFGIPGTALFASTSTLTSTGAVNAMHDSFTPLGGMSPMLHMMLGEISPGGAGVGLMGMLHFALLAVFIAGLMVGRTPEYLGKKIQASEMKLVTLYILAMPLALLGFAAASMMLRSADTYQTGPHGLSEVLYNFASATNNNGSAFAYQNTSTQWYTVTQGIAMLIGRFFLIIPALAVGASLAGKPKVPTTAGTLPTHTALFGGLIVGVVIIVAGLTFFPALALGPILEHLSI
jgi:K+-transporting ATPase ATPase A chain